MGKTGRRKNPYKQSYKAVFGALTLLLAPSPAAATDQTTAQEEARRLNNRGSDDSLDASYGNALQALGHFYNLNIPGAISKGVKAYGQYRNSEKLDDLKDKNQQLAGSMSSVGAGRPSASGITGTTQYVSPYARIDRKFLHEGETAKVAEKIEKLSGISRDKMFQMAVDIHTNSKTLDDPDFVPWAMKTYKDTVKQVPNEDFRNALTKFGGLAEGLITSGAAKGVLAQFKRVDTEKPTMIAKEETPAAQPPAQEAKVSPPTEAIARASPIPEPPGAAMPQNPERTEDPSSAFSSRGLVGDASPNQRPGFDRIQLDPTDQFFVKLSQQAGDEDTIFRTVSRKIKDVSARQTLERRHMAVR